MVLNQMTDHNAKPHRWANVIIAWANGQPIQRRSQHGGFTWSPWIVVDKGRCSFLDDLNVEYRIQPEREPHKWQLEREAYLAGKTVQWRVIPEPTDDPELLELSWFKLDDHIEAMCRKDSAGSSIWDRDWLEFRIAEEVVIRQLQIMPSGRAWYDGKPNCCLTFRGGKLTNAEVLQ